MVRKDYESIKTLLHVSSSICFLKVIICFLFCGLLFGCIPLYLPVPFKVHHSGNQISEERISRIEVNGTSKKDIFRRFGSPDLHFESKDIIVYNWENVKAYWAVLVPFMGGGGGVIPRCYSLAIDFDENEKVERYELLVMKSCDDFEKVIKKWVSVQ